MASSLPRIRVQKMGTRAGQPHYGVDCLGCPAWNGMHAVIAMGHLSKDGARAAGAAHLASDHGRAS